MKNIHYGKLNEVLDSAILNFYEYRNVTQVIYEKQNQFDLRYLPKKLLDAEKYLAIKKDDTPAFALNNLRINYRQATNFESANVCFIDYDFKNEIQIKDFKQQYKKYDPMQPLKKNIEQFKIDMSKYAWISANSFSGKGLRFVFLIMNRIGNDYISTILKDDVFTANDVHKSNINYVNDLMLKKTGVSANDDSVNSICLTTYTCRKNGAIINDVVHIKDFKFSNKTCKNKQYEKKSIEEVKTENESIKSSYNWKKLDNINGLNFHYDDVLPFLSALAVYTDNDIRERFYYLIKRNYTGKALRRKLVSFNSFSKYLDNLSFSQYSVPMRYCFERLGIFKNKDASRTNKDVFGFEYTNITEVDKYIEDFDFLSGITGNTVVNAGTGMGKTTQSVIYLNKLSGIKIFVAPTNVILEQTLPKCDELNISYVPFYSKSNKLSDINENLLIITNYQNLERLRTQLENHTCTSVIMDEAHKITDYSNFDKDNYNKQLLLPSSKQYVYISATPEHFLIGAEKNCYFKFVKKSDVKRKVKLIYFKSKKVLFEAIAKAVSMNANKVNIIYNNHKDENTKFREELKDKYNINFELVSSDNKGAAYDKIISKSVVEQNILTTAILNDGVNINNNVDSIFIVDNNTQSIFDIYQFSNRFRNSYPHIYIMRLATYNEDFKLRDLDLKQHFESAYRNKIATLNKDIGIINSYYSNSSLDVIEIPAIFFQGRQYRINYNLVKYEIVKDFKEKVQHSYVDYRYFMRYFFDIENETFIKTKRKTGFTKLKKDEIKPFVLKHFNSWVINNLNDCDLLSPDENKLYQHYKKTIETYFKRYNALREFDEFNKEAIFMRSSNYHNYIRKKRTELLRSKHKRTKLDNAIIADMNTVESIVGNNNTLEYFKNEIAKYELLSENRIDLSSTRTINKGLKALGYELKRKTVRIKKELKHQYFIIKSN